MFSLYLKFDEALGEEGLARDYSVLGEENFEEIIKCYKETFMGRYATREDLGGVGNVDYLIVPRLYHSNHYQENTCMAFGELGEVYYFPINLVASWSSQFPIDAYNIETARKNPIVNEDKAFYFRELSSFQRFSSQMEFGLYGLSHSQFNKYKNSPVTFLSYKKSFLGDFESIIKYKSDFFFTEDGFRLQALAFLTSKGISIKENGMLEKIVPSFLKYMTSFVSRKPEKESLVIIREGETENKTFYCLFTEKNHDIALQRIGPLNISKCITKNGYYVEGDKHFWNYFDGYIVKYPHRSVKYPVTKLEVGIPTIDPLKPLVKSILDNYTNPISIKVIYKPRVDIKRKLSDVDMVIEVVSIGENGFVKVGKVSENILSNNEKLALFNRLFFKKSELLMSKEDYPVFHLVEIDKIRDITEVVSDNITESIFEVNPKVADRELGLLSSNWIKNYYSLSSNKNDIESITHLFMNKDMYEGDRLSINNTFLNKFIVKYSQLMDSPLRDSNYKISFSTTDSSLKITKRIVSQTTEPKLFLLVSKTNDNYIKIHYKHKTIEEEDILWLYKEVIKYAFFLQQNWVKRYGKIEFVLDLFVNGICFKAVTTREVFLLTETLDEIKINRSHTNYRSF